MNYLLLALLFSFAAILFIGGILNMIGRQDQELAEESEPYNRKQFPHETRREILTKTIKELYE